MTIKYHGQLICRRNSTEYDLVFQWLRISVCSYRPANYTQSILISDEADSDPDRILSDMMWNVFDSNYNVDRRTANPMGSYQLDHNGYPLNPLGRTGLTGRGVFKRWGVNYQTHLVIMMSTHQSTSGREIFKYLMRKSHDTDYYRLPSTWTTGTTMPAITKTLKLFLMNIYRTWHNNEYVDMDRIHSIIEHLTFVSTAYIGTCVFRCSSYLFQQ
jgi:hypothetical protein